MTRTLLIAAFLLAPALTAQTAPATAYSVRTPQIHFSDDTTPSIVTAPPELPGAPAEPQLSNAPPASTALLATRHFDFIVSPVAPLSIHGSMADTSISLGEYARQLRAQGEAAATKTAPDAMAQPAKPK